MWGEKTIFSKTIILHEEWQNFCKPLLSNLTEVIWIVISTSAFNLLHYPVLVQEHEENLDSQKYIVDIREKYFNGLSDISEYSSLILHKKHTSSCFSKISCMWNLKPHQGRFPSVPLKHTGLFTTLNGLYPCIVL